jgi:hypothetical protein
MRASPRLDRSTNRTKPHKLSPRRVELLPSAAGERRLSTYWSTELRKATQGGHDFRAEQEELLGLLAPMRGDIVEVESPETGTPLPRTYETAHAVH